MEPDKIVYRVSTYEKGLLQLRAKNCSMSMSAYSRQAILGHKIRENVTRKQMKIYKKLIRCQGELVELAKDTRKDCPELSQKYRELAELLKGEVMDFRK